MVLQKIEEILGERGKHIGIASHFDLIAGTSTGGLIGLALASPIDRINLDFTDQELQDEEERQNKPRFTPSHLKDMYKTHLQSNKRLSESLDSESVVLMHESEEPLQNPKIPGSRKSLRVRTSLMQRLRKYLSEHKMSKKDLGKTNYIDLSKILYLYENRGEDIFPKSAFRQLQSITQVFSDKYSVRSFETILNHIFGDMTIHEAETPVLVVTYDCYSGKPYIISSAGDDHYYMRDAARATSAAPTYFPALLVTPLNRKDDLHYLIDGGVAANNPSLLAYLEAKKLYPDASHYHILSLGTASKKFSLSIDQISHGGVVSWLDPVKGTPLYSVMRSSQSEITDYTLQSLPDVSYYRINGIIKQKHVKLDDASKENITILKVVGNKMIEEYQQELHDFCDLLPH